jgi:hypothetical protein
MHLLGVLLFACLILILTIPIADFFVSINSMMDVSIEKNSSILSQGWCLWCLYEEGFKEEEGGHWCNGECAYNTSGKSLVSITSDIRHIYPQEIILWVKQTK